MTNNTFSGWAAIAKDKPLELTQLPLKTFDDDTVEMRVTHCGLCASDIETIENGWGNTVYPSVTGHEIVGVCTAVGDNVKNIRVGDRIGVGGQSGSCHKCKNCQEGEENICEKSPIFTFGSCWPKGDKTYGGFADKWRGDYRFAYKIPDDMTNEIAATFFCAGITTYSPLVRHNVTKESKVGVIGVGGLGHFAIQWAKAMGAEVVAFSSSERKREDAVALGCDDYVVTSDAEKMSLHQNTLTHVVCTAYSASIDWSSYFALMTANSHFIMLALPREPMVGFYPGPLAFKQISFVGSMVGSPSMMESMLQFAVKHDVKPWIKKYSMKDIAQAIDDFKIGKARYRFVLEN
ncbi:chaperonin 10-like protein [Sporodiniella umbellata]|nr:chaperonin 10-like protein [Sporodiniella umbellata]